MGTIIASLPGDAAGGMGVVVVGEEPEADDRDPVNMRAALFFDGTLNNRTNIETRLANITATEVTINGQRIVMQDNSYDSSYSNVAIMDYMNKIEDEQTEVSVYVEGIGTTDSENDDERGYAWGAGPTGVPAKVTRGIIALKAKIDNLLGEEKRLEQLTVDVFGFSRGAAAARHFVARRTAEFFSQYINLSDTLPIPPENIILNFVGVFDTVSSYGGEFLEATWAQVAANLVLDTFSDDVDQLKLAMGGAPVRAVQLGAANEYRVAFARTTITSSIQAGKGFECTLPGVHSDLGGGYKPGIIEERVVDAYERQRLIDEGWYRPEQLPLPSGFWHWLGTSNRSTGHRTVRNEYQFIPLSIMMQLAQKFEVTFEPFPSKFAAYAVPSLLQPLSALMHRYVLDRHDTAPSEEANYVLPPAFHWVRNQYLHRSAVKGYNHIKESITMGGRETNQLPDRQIISDRP